MDFTAEQKTAIFTDDKNLIVVAGAGSGKTRVLVERYLYLLESNPTWPLNALVAITFTREAAFEMRDRVRQSLEKKVQNPENAANRQRWSELLGQMDSARIDTIHGLCATILRANAAEARVDPRFDVLEPTDSASLLADVIDAELYGLAQEDVHNLASLFTEYDSRDIREVLSDAEMLSAELGEIPRDAAVLFRQWQEEWESEYRAAAERASKKIEALLKLVNLPAPGDRLADIFYLIEAQWDDFLCPDLAISLQAASIIRNSIKVNVGTASNWGDKETLMIAKAILKDIRDVHLDNLLGHYGIAPNYLDKRAAEILLLWYELLSRIQASYRAAKAEQGYLDFNDLEALTAELLRNHADVRGRYQGKEFKRLLVDEFQDTNQQQWDIVRHLASLENDVAMFLVGDPKQSIYAFRGADVSVFASVQAEIAGHRNGIKTPLQQSFRSHAPLIKAFNALFEHILVQDEDSPVARYEIAFDSPMEAFRLDAPDPGCESYAPIELLLQVSEYEGTKVPIEERRLWEALEIARRLQQLKDRGALIHDKESNSLRAFDYGDAALLFQSTSNITLYEQVFKNEGIPFVTVGGRGYYNRQEVWDVLNLLRALHNAADNLSLAAALRSPMFGFSDEMLFALRLLTLEGQKKPMPLWDALQREAIPYLDVNQLERLRFARETLHELKNLAGRVTISELLRQALAKTGYLAALTGLKGGARLRRNVEKLVEIAENSGKITLPAFSYYLNDLTDKEVREGEAALDSSGAVRLMTVHASKGLEFPIVILVDSDWTMRGGLGAKPLLYDGLKQRLACKVFDDAERKLAPSFSYASATRLKTQREEAERKRLLYVAATRARDCLIVSGAVSIRKEGSFSVGGWLKWLLEALAIDSFGEMSDGHHFAYGDSLIRIGLPKFDAEMLKRLRGADDTADWQSLKIETEAEMPPLMQPVRVASEAMMGHIAATQLANLGAFRYARNAEERHYYRNSVQREVLDDAPAQIQEAVRTHDPRIRPRQLGEVVHEALRYWRFPAENPNIDAILQSYAWQQNITEPNQVKEVVKLARGLLERFQAESDVYKAISSAKAAKRPFYAELPFIYRTEKRILHGVIDALFQHEDGDWWLIDYKTSTVQGGLPNLNDHARRYHLQVGAYASAVSKELAGIVPRVFIYYIQYNRRVEVPAAIWQAEVQKLEDYLGELIGQHYA
jgi:ATP-dependent helicase/nuclease subunit A